MTEDSLTSQPLEALWHRPGFMIRRAHQIAQALFLSETGELGITSTQYGVLRILETYPGLDQIGVARLLGQDRSTTALVIEKLLKDGLILRGRSDQDRRRAILALSKKGENVLSELAVPVRRSHDTLLSVFNQEEKATFLALLEKLVDHFNEESRTPLDPTAADRFAQDA